MNMMMKNTQDAILETSIESPESIPQLASLVPSINARIPEIGFVLLKRLAHELRVTSEPRHIHVLHILSQLLGCLINQRVVYDILATQFLLVLLKKPEDEERIEVAINFLLECGYTLLDNSPTLLDYVFERLVEIYNSREVRNISRRLIESMFIIKRDCFPGFEIRSPALEDQFTHEIPLDYHSDHESLLDVLKANLGFLENINLGTEKSLKNVLHCDWEVVKNNKLCG
ncbi:hypothetical protein LIER_37770 [Lithospermum erythrorhizon]|uniref:MIF4G domain-containing protein n=1 Tax=Lithospermum erythrorhizon TaxID=34254 RepID=A0AAV3PQA9_LITER